MKTEEYKVECRACKKGHMVRRYTPKHDRYFYGCSNFPRCRGSMSVKEYDAEMLELIGEIPEDDLLSSVDWPF